MKLGIIGGGQLGQMLALAGIPLGIESTVLSREAQPPAAACARIVSNWADLAGLEAVTYELEHVPLAKAQALAEQVPLYPPWQALEVSQDRLREKDFLRSLNIPTAPYQAVANLTELRGALAQIPAPAILKSRQFGYDGRGQFRIQEPAQAQEAWQAISAPAILEGTVNFERELSIIAVRSRSGETAFYPLIENRHQKGILRVSFAPAPVTFALQNLAQSYAERVLRTLDYVGTITLELFQIGEQLIANEIAPRVHNSGHWTIEGARTSQFENHLRGVLGLPLGPTDPTGVSVMFNLIGGVPPVKEALSFPGAHLHLYGKEPRAGRKLGHLTLWAPEADELRPVFPRVQELVTNYSAG